MTVRRFPLEPGNGDHERCARSLPYDVALGSAVVDNDGSLWIVHDVARVLSVPLLRDIRLRRPTPDETILYEVMES
jgi:hypothetical protein